MRSATLYYQLKPCIPRAAQIWLRRGYARIQRRRHAASWPVDPESARVPADWPGWPDGKRFGLVLTHDVDTARGVARCARVMALERELGFRSSFNLVPERYALPAGLRREIEAAGYEVGVHGLKHDGKLYRSRRVFAARAARINGYLQAWGAAGFRSPAMHHRLDWLGALDMAYDASTFDTDPFEPQQDPARTVFPFRVPRADGRPGFIELPYTLPQDSTLFILLRETTLDIWMRKLEWIRERGGMALVIAHPDYMRWADGSGAPDEYPAELYEAFLRAVRRYAGEYWHGLPRELTQYLDARGYGFKEHEA
ncbi:MAG: hypothetical protein JW951_09470 [Lentisphaerae bacterium]|nr:hypothetical protein [Lentisphaerota bacterium]